MIKIVSMAREFRFFFSYVRSIDNDFIFLKHTESLCALESKCTIAVNATAMSATKYPKSKTIESQRQQKNQP